MAAPVWQSGSALVYEISASGALRIDVGAKVSNANAVDEIMGAGIRSWMLYNEATRILTLTDAPIVREDEVIVVRFRASNADGSTDADFKITLKGSVLASLHNSLFFKECLNYETGRVEVQGAENIITEMTDNDYSTFSRETDINIDMSDSAGNPTAFDYIFIKYKGDLTQYTGTVSGGQGSGFTRLLPETLKNFEGAVVSMEINGFKHDLFPLPAGQTATSVRMEFAGSGLEIYALMLLELGQEIDANDSFTGFSYKLVDRSGDIAITPGGRGRRSPPIGNARWKLEYTFRMLRDTVRMNIFRAWAHQYPNCVFAPEPSRDPDWVFPAYFPALIMGGEYFTEVKSNGELVAFEVAEQ